MIWSKIKLEITFGDFFSGNYVWLFFKSQKKFKLGFFSTLFSIKNWNLIYNSSIFFSVFGGENVETLSLGDFLVGVGQLKFRGTSYLLRSPISVITYLKDKYEEKPTTTNASVNPTKRRRRNDSAVDNGDGDEGVKGSSNNVTDLQPMRQRNPSLAASDSSLPSFLVRLCIIISSKLNSEKNTSFKNVEQWE